MSLCAFSDDDGQFRDAGPVVLPIIVDSIPTLKEFTAREDRDGVVRWAFAEERPKMRPENREILERLGALP